MSGLLTHPTWMEMDYAALGSNVAALRRRLAPGTRLIASVKANAYGHGIIEVARRLAELAVDTLATGSLRDALAVREAGIGADIIMLGATLPEGIPQLLEHGFVWSMASCRRCTRWSWPSPSAGQPVARLASTSRSTAATVA
jgi:alanine racemase